MRLKKLIIQNYRCFGETAEEIDIDSLTTFIGNNSVGKTAALSALNCLFSENSSERILKRKDFHLPINIEPEKLEEQSLFIETIFEFDELNESSNEGLYSIPLFFKSMVIDNEYEIPYLRIRLEATWQKSNNIEGAIESRISYITCPCSEKIIPEENKITASRSDLDNIRVLYIPAVRDTSKQLRNVSGAMMYQIMNSINWSDETKNNIKLKIRELNEEFMKENGISIIDKSINSQWKIYDTDSRYSDAKLRFNSIDFESSMKKSEIVFFPTETGKEFRIDEMGDGLRSLFYISMVDSILSIEKEIQKELESKPAKASFNRKPPILTIIALEEPENHIAPHLIGKLIENLKNIAKKCNAQIILTSHSPAIVKRIEPENLRYFRIKVTELTTKIRRITLPSITEEQYKYIKEAVMAYPELYFANLVILGEGDSEEILIPKFWQAKNNSIDISGISVVPLGGRHVNHFWRLLNDIEIPFITLLDLDRERDGGGWGRIKYVIKQLLKNGKNKEELLSIENKILSEKELETIDALDVTQIEYMQQWINKLKNYHVFFSSPLDIDFLMISHFDDKYKALLNSKEGPRFMTTINGEKKQKSVLDIENKNEMTDEMKTDFSNKIKECVRHVLKECGGDGETYTDDEKSLMIWYSYFFLHRGKPTTHIAALSKITNEELCNKIPKVLNDLIQDAEYLLRRTD